MVEEELAGINLNDTVYIIRFHEDDRLRSRYLVEFLNSSAGQAQLLSTNIGGAVIPTLRLTGLRKLKVAIPNRAVVELIKDIHDVEQILIRRVDKARNLRQKLFSIENPELFDEQLRDLSVEAQVLSESIIRADDLNFQVRNYYPYVIAYPYRALDALQIDASFYKAQLRVAENLLGLSWVYRISLGSCYQIAFRR